jgi:hypothetical protein
MAPLIVVTITSMLLLIFITFQLLVFSGELFISIQIYVLHNAVDTSVIPLLYVCRCQKIVTTYISMKITIKVSVLIRDIDYSVLFQKDYI